MTPDRPGDRPAAPRRGQVVTGRVTEIAGFGGTFVDLGGRTGMINLPELSWRPVRHPTDVVRVGQLVTVEVLDGGPAVLALSLRAPRENPWPGLVGRVGRVGRVVTGPVTKRAPIGVFVRVEDRADGLEGLLPVGELADAHPEVGDLISVRIVAVDPVRRRIALSPAPGPGPGGGGRVSG
ncbi:S1 RNA-binding domain-containing protein [Streptomyces sp. DSM 44915]|uniref:S1 RNA-binding domain-containing protein n=1 Tax=Streptomyces chisholmiae TaxID=3075540 RepID=A0ABU2JLS9_9ACTN|nr:S1 RNA-binding domain-containing protein [Streptomyces sp. DSM 44915]MDT0265919.1 S1 RNA-binding domain-containing protein [Streptomyces sp. DSM 44915]